MKPKAKPDTRGTMTLEKSMLIERGRYQAWEAAQEAGDQATAEQAKAVWWQSLLAVRVEFKRRLSALKRHCQNHNVTEAELLERAAEYRLREAETNRSN